MLVDVGDTRLHVEERGAYRATLRRVLARV